MGVWNFIQDQILGMLDEAEAQGIAATDAEIEAFMTAQKDNYEKFPEASAMIDDYCKGAGMYLLPSLS